MTGVVELTDSTVIAASEGSDWARAYVLEVLAPRVRLMVWARLAPSLAQLRAVDDLAEEALAALAAGLTRLETRTTTGLKAFLSGIVRHKVEDFLRADGGVQGVRPVIRSLDSTVSSFSQVGPLWQFLSASGVSPRTAIDHAERISLLMVELGQLAADHREILTLAFFDQLPLAEIAERMQRSREAASMLLKRAILTLRQNMIAASAPERTCGRTE